jgi:hypothetical protein
MKRFLTFLSTLVLVGAIQSQAGEVLPPRFNFDRYSEMVEQSPFSIATAAALPAATPNFAKDLYVANAAHSPEGDLVTIGSSSDTNFKKYLTTKEPVDGYGIANIEWSDRVGATKVTISKDGNFATLTFNEALLSQRAPNVPPQPQPQPFPNTPPGLSIQRPGPARPSVNLPAPSLGTPGGGRRGITRPHARGVIPRAPGGNRLAPPPPGSLTPKSN